MSQRQTNAVLKSCAPSRCLSCSVSKRWREHRWPLNAGPLRKVLHSPLRRNDRQEHTTRITFGMIVLNGEPFIKHNLRALYPFAHQIIVAEGACPGAASAATADGHSLDTTLTTV